MPARRPYASRGVPRRATSYRSGPGHSLAVVPAALVIILALTVGALVWVIDPSRFGLPASLIDAVTRSRASGSIDGPGSPVAANVGTAAGAESALRMAEVAQPTAAGSGTNAAATAMPSLHQWQASVPGLRSDPALAGRLDQVLAGVDGHVSVAVKDLGTGRGAALDGDREMPSASLYKLPVLYSVFEAGLNMGEELLINDEALSYDAGTMELGAGETLSVAEALERMVTISDNTSAVMLGGRVGSSRVNANLAALGMETTHYSLERMTTSALDMLHLLDLLAHGQAVTPASSADMLHLLLRQRVNDRLPRLLPSEVEIAHKTGNLPGTVNDVGLVYGPSSTLAVAVLITETTDETTAATAIARVAQAAYAYFGDQPEVHARPTIPPAPARAVPPVWRQPKPVPPTPTPVPTGAPNTSGVEPTAAPQLVPATPLPTPAPPATAVPAGTGVPVATAVPAATGVAPATGVPAATAIVAPPPATATEPPTPAVAPHPATPTPLLATRAATRLPLATPAPTPKKP